MSHISVYRRWRPQTFEEVIGQERITRTLQNAIRAGRITHAYLFAGHRGTGKTTVARILAKALNCARGPTPNPDNTCSACQGINQGSSLDVIEIDGASHTQVDHIRDLKEKVVLAPAAGRYKVYIIDEVHMLSTSAFNALLKTLEEPPGHAVFVLVTTEPHKIPATVASRCQRFDFRRVPLAEIEARLRRITQAEGFAIEDRALRHIARLADGSVRDAESVLDQLSAYKDEGITTADILTILGAPAEETLFALVDGLLRRDAVEVLRVAAALIDEGKESRQIMRTLLEHFRDLLVVKVAQQAEGVLDTTPERLAALQRQAGTAQLADVLRAVKILSDADVEARAHSQPRLLLEISLIRLARPEMDPTIEGLQARVQALEGGAGPPRATAPAARAHPESPAAHPASSKDHRTGDEPPPPQDRTPPARRAVRRDGPKAEATTAPAPVPPPARPLPPATAAPPAAAPMPAAVPQGAAAGSPPAGAALEVTLQDVRNRWARVLEEVKRIRMFCHALLIEGVPQEVRGETLIVGLRSGYNFHVDSLHRPENRAVVEQALERVFGRRLHLRCQVQPAAGATGATGPSATVAASSATVGATPAATPVAGTAAGPAGEDADPLVARAVELFGGEVVEVRPATEPA